MARWCASRRAQSETDDIGVYRTFCEQLTLHGIVEGKHYTRTRLVRVLTAIMLALATTSITIMTFIMITNQEVRIADEQYDSVSVYTGDALVRNVEQRRLAVKALAQLYGEGAPDVAQWPNITNSAFDAMARVILPDSMTGSISYVPIVQPDERAGFQHFAFSYFDSESSIPAAAGESDFGSGIFKFDFNSNNADHREPDFDGVPDDFDSDYHILTPVVQRTVLGSRYTNSDYLFNVHSSEQLGEAMDNAIACVENVADASSQFDCGFLSDTISTRCADHCDDINEDDLVTMAIVEPIVPSHNRTTVVGFVVVEFSWLNVLDNIIPSDTISNLDVVIESSSGSKFTYAITNGKARLRGKGDKHDDDYNLYDESTTGLVDYEITFYPTDSFFEEYESHVPRSATIGVSMIMLFTIAVFIIHDYFLKRESNDRQAVLESRRKFVRFISHEIRTPLNTVFLGLKLLESEIKEFMVAHPHPCGGAVTLNESSVRSVGTANTNVSLFQSMDAWLDLTSDISSNTQSAIAVLNDLLNYDKIKMGAMELDMSTVDIWTLFKAVSQSFQTQARQSDIELVLKLPVDDEEQSSIIRDELRMMRVLGDDMRLTQVIRNLISNALKFTPAKGSVTISGSYVDTVGQTGMKERDNTRDDLQPIPGTLRFTVKDTGAGLSAEQLQRMFSEGVQFNAKELQAGQGSGLGLAISKGLVEQHHGTMKVESEGLGHGCTFTIELPAYRIINESAAAPAIVPQTEIKQDIVPSTARLEEEPADIPMKACKILVVDDSPTNRKMLMRLLTRKSHGHRCVEAEDGLKALERYDECDAEDPFDCVLMDYEMPHMTGPEAAKELRTRGCTLLIVGITGNVLPADRAHYLEMGADEVLSKPLDMDELQRVWSKYMSNKKDAKENLRVTCDEKCDETSDERWIKSDDMRPTGRTLMNTAKVQPLSVP